MLVAAHSPIANGIGGDRMILRLCTHVALALLLSAASFAQDEPAAPSEAEATLMRMRDYIRDNPTLQFQTTFHSTGELRGAGSKGTARFYIRRPNSFRIEMTSNKRSTTSVSDGKTLTIFRPGQHKYAQLPAKDSILGTMYLAAGLMVIQARMIDFFWTVDFSASRGTSVTIAATGPQTIGTRKCDGFTVERFEDKWEVWLETSGIPLPCKLVSRRLDGSGHTSQTNTFVWEVDQIPPPETFDFSPPKGSKEVGISEIK